jgi:hypothetical protein
MNAGIIECMYKYFKTYRIRAESSRITGVGVWGNRTWQLSGTCV